VTKNAGRWFGRAAAPAAARPAGSGPEAEAAAEGAASLSAELDEDDGLE